MLIPEFMGGLGNLLFQFSSTYGIAKQTGHSFGISHIPAPPEKHSRTKYGDNIMKLWSSFLTRQQPVNICREHNLQPVSLDGFRRTPNSQVIKTFGYWQNWNYIEPVYNDVVNLISLNDEVIMKYTDIDEAYFLHVRRGDYVGHSYHELNLTNYWKQAVQRCSQGNIAYIVSNDIPWCEQWSFLDDIRHRFVNENDVDTLSVMAKCAKGGIAANSSFSWLGLYLNRKRPFIIVPNRWFPHDELYIQGYYFPETQPIAV